MPVPVNGTPSESAVISVAIGRWAVAPAPLKIRTLLGSCVGVVLFDRVGKVGGIAHVVLPNSRGAADHPGKYADTAIPVLLEDLEKLAKARVRTRLTAKLLGGARMFATAQAEGIGEQNQRAVEQQLSALGIPVLARDLGGETGRRVTLDTTSGLVAVKIPGGPDYEI